VANPRIGSYLKSIVLVSHPAPTTYPQDIESFGAAVFKEMCGIWMTPMNGDVLNFDLCDLEK
jgi:hypothetical protein